MNPAPSLNSSMCYEDGRLRENKNLRFLNKREGAG